jgi:hypothetical protein
MRWLLSGSVVLYGFYFFLLARESQTAKYTVRLD